MQILLIVLGSYAIIPLLKLIFYEIDLSKEPKCGSFNPYGNGQSDSFQLFVFFKRRLSFKIAVNPVTKLSEVLSFLENKGHPVDIKIQYFCCGNIIIESDPDKSLKDLGIGRTTANLKVEYIQTNMGYQNNEFLTKKKYQKTQHNDNINKSKEIASVFVKTKPSCLTESNIIIINNRHWSIEKYNDENMMIEQKETLSIDLTDDANELNFATTGSPF